MACGVLIIGDVSGKGIPAAFYMAHVKGHSAFFGRNGKVTE
jgi:serine phosphatase RsbU (regulator of sigma subunit)